ncbi:PspE Rhodanese-related sulfurtransferase [Candidatus Nanopelagicaceae bacterium]
MKKVIAVLAASALFLTGCGESGATNLGAEDFQAKASEAGVVVLDVRTGGEFMTGHIANAVNIDVEGMTFDGDIKSLDKEATYAVYCHSGRRSVIAVNKLKDAGFKNLFNLTNGIQDWQGAGLPLVTN